MRSKHADTRGLQEIRERLLGDTDAADTAMGPDDPPPLTRAEYASLCNRLSRVESALRTLLRTNGA